MSSSHQPLDSAVHRVLLLDMIERGHVPELDELAVTVAASEADVRESLARLDTNHGVVLHPGTFEPWVIHPFSTTPTLFYVARRTPHDPSRGVGDGWWAPCIWCALGIAALVREPVRIHTKLGGRETPCAIDVDGDVGSVTASGPRQELVVPLAHFPIPIARAWDNVHRFCACMLVFASASDVDEWSRRHGIERGEILTLDEVAALARAWYGNHLSPDWRKPTADEAQAIFRRVGLTSAHWHVRGGGSRF